jgi:integrase
VPNIALTDLSIRALKAEKRTDFWCNKTPGFGIRVGKLTKTFIVKRGNSRIKLGPYPQLSLQEARKKASAVKYEEPEAKPLSFNEAVDRFVKLHCEQKNRPSTAKGTERLLRKHFGHLRSLNCGKRKILDVLDQLAVETPGEANHAFVAARTFFRWCERRDYCANSMRTLQMPCPRKRRKRILNDDELRAVWKAAGEMESDFGEIVRLLMLTGQRRGEIGGLRDTYYSHNRQTVCLPGELTKNRQEHTFPVGPMASAMIAKRLTQERTNELLFPARGSALPFSGWSKCKKALDKLVNIPPWTLHDLRRTFRTNLGRLKVRPDIAERLVNHITARTEMEETYDLYTYLPEMREAMLMWEAFLQGLCFDNQTPLASKAA